MSKIKWIAGAIAASGGVVVLAVAGAAFWATRQVDAVFATQVDHHTVDFPIPFPLTEAEVAAIRAERIAALGPADTADGAPDPMADVDLDAIALERARERGDHYVRSIYACTTCHGGDLTGGTMIDDGAIGTVVGPNLTPGGPTKGFTAADWDRIVRHGVLRDGTTSIMPVLDFQRLTDRELSDIAAYLTSLPPKPGREASRSWGPIGTMLIATGQLVPDAARVDDHHAAHAAEPPEAAPTVAYGEHIATVCTGCHRADFSGGPMPFGPPDWPPASNLTPHQTGLAGWTAEEFDRAMRTGIRKNGEAFRAPMSEVLPMAANMTDTEMHAMFAYLRSIEARPMGD